MPELKRHRMRGCYSAARLQAPAQSTIGAGRRRPVRLERATEFLIRRTAPNVSQGLLRGVAERVILVAALREWRDAARQGAAVGSDVHDRPRPAAQRPWRAIVATLEAHA